MITSAVDIRKTFSLIYFIFCENVGLEFGFFVYSQVRAVIITHRFPKRYSKARGWLSVGNKSMKI